MSARRLRLAELVEAVEHASTLSEAGGRLACVLVVCSTCGAERGRSCVALDGTGDRVRTVHAERRHHAATWLRTAPS